MVRYLKAKVLNEIKLSLPENLIVLCTSISKNNSAYSSPCLALAIYFLLLFEIYLYFYFSWYVYNKN